MIISHSRSHTGRVYDYFTCVGKHQKRTGCTLRAVRIARIEELVEDHYGTIVLPPQIREILEPRLRADLEEGYAGARQERTQLVKRQSRLLDERSKLLRAHYAGAIPLELLKTEQDRISREITSIEARLEQSEDHQASVQAALQRALALTANCQAAYLSAPTSIRRQFNQFFYDRLEWDGNELKSRPSRTFTILRNACRAAASNSEAKIDWAAWEAGLNDSDPGEPEVAGVKDTKLVAGAGCEPATSGL